LNGEQAWDGETVVIREFRGVWGLREEEAWFEVFSSEKAACPFRRSKTRLFAEFTSFHHPRASPPKHPKDEKNQTADATKHGSPRASAPGNALTSARTFGAMTQRGASARPLSAFQRAVRWRLVLLSFLVIFGRSNCQK
jgi:hypothetical protein